MKPWTGSCAIARALLTSQTMPRGDKSKYTDKQKRMAEHIEEGYESQGAETRRRRSRG